MIFSVVYDTRVVSEDIPKLSSHEKKRIRIAIEQKLTVAPDIFGKPLRRSLKSFRKLRVGDYRVIFRIEGNKVKVFCIGRRSIVYEIINRRI